MRLVQSSHGCFRQAQFRSDDLRTLAVENTGDDPFLHAIEVEGRRYPSCSHGFIDARNDDQNLIDVMLDRCRPHPRECKFLMTCGQRNRGTRPSLAKARRSGRCARPLPDRLSPGGSRLQESRHRHWNVALQEQPLSAAVHVAKSQILVNDEGRKDKFSEQCPKFGEHSRCECVRLLAAVQTIRAARDNPPTSACANGRTRQPATKTRSSSTGGADPTDDGISRPPIFRGRWYCR